MIDDAGYCVDHVSRRSQPLASRIVKQFPAFPSALDRTVYFLSLGLTFIIADYVQRIYTKTKFLSILSLPRRKIYNSFELLSNHDVILGTLSFGRHPENARDFSAFQFHLRIRVGSMTPA